MSHCHSVVELRLTTMCLALLFALMVVSPACGHSSVAHYTVSVWHSLQSPLAAASASAASDAASFSQRGVITVDSVRSDATAVYTPAGPLTASQLQQLQDLANVGGFYRLKLIAKSVDGDTSELATFGKACQLLEAGLSESLLLTFDYNGRLLAASQLAVARCHGNSSAATAAAALATPTIRSTILLHQVEQGPSPDTATFIRRMEEEKLSKQRGEHKDNRSFIAKYWMYIVPVVLLLMISGGSEQSAGNSR